MLNKISKLLKDIKIKNPLVHHITNYVTVNDCANIVLALGGSPVMADDIDEVEEMVSIASGLVLNIGTLNERIIKSMIKAGKKANELHIPVILDPVGAGATSLRTNTVQKLIKEIDVQVIRGNMSEIKAILGEKSNTKGVDSVEGMADAEQIALKLASKTGCVVAITGSKDVITDGKRMSIIKNGHQIMSHITGTGCMCTSVVATYSSITNDYYLSSVAGVLTMGLSGEIAYKNLKDGEGTGTYRCKLIDSIYKLKSEDILKGGLLDVK